jgi:hypothetical protein
LDAIAEKIGCRFPSVRHASRVHTRRSLPLTAYGWLRVAGHAGAPLRIARAFPLEQTPFVILDFSVPTPTVSKTTHQFIR